MTPEDRVRDLLIQAWSASLDTDPDTWDNSPWAHIVFLIGERLSESETDAIVAVRLARSTLAGRLK